MRPFIVALLVLCPAFAGASGSLSVSLEDPPLEGVGLDKDRIFARIDSLTVVHESSDGSPRAAAAYRLGQLYLATGLAKHKRLALDYLEEASERGDDPFPAARLRARTAQQMRYTRNARQWFEQLTDDHPGDPRSHQQLARFYFSEAKGVLHEEKFRRARNGYLAAVQADSTFVAGWYGLAASMIALEEYDGAIIAASRLASFPSTRAAGFLLAGACGVALGEFDAAEHNFRVGFGLLDDDARDVFLHAKGFLSDRHLADPAVLGVDPALLRRVMKEKDANYRTFDEIDPKLVLENEEVRERAVDVYWRTRETWPTSLVNRRRLAFWQRLVEADLLFGDPDAGLRGWDTEMGSAIARWGRPDFMIYEPPSPSIDLDHWYFRGVRLPTSTNIPSLSQLWVWTYRRDGVWFSLLFTDPTYHSAWKAESSTVALMIAQSREAPMLFFDNEENAKFELTMGSAAFPRPENALIECYAGILLDEKSAPLADEALLMEWAIYNDDDARIEYQRRNLDPSHLRSSLTASLGESWSSEAEDAVLSKLIAALTPGAYRVAIDVSSPTRGHRGAEIYLNVPLPYPPGLLALSDLQVASTVAPYDPTLTVPPEYVKYAYGVLPLPNPEVSARAEELFVFFEAYNLTPNEAGLTHFTVTYEVLQAPPKVELPPQGATLDRSQLVEVPLSGVTFLEERTGLAPEGHVVKGGSVAIDALAPGRYVLVVRVEDLQGRATTERFVTFRKARG